MDIANKPTYRFDHIEVDALRSCVIRDGQVYYLRQQTFQVLLYLLKNHQRVVGKDELVEQIWDDTAVTDNALVQCITTIRKTLGDDSRNPRFIRTIPKVGYRFIRPIEESPSNGSSFAGQLGPDRPTMAAIHRIALGRGGISALHSRAAAFAVAALVLIGGSWFILRRPGRVPSYATLHPGPGKRAIAVVYFDNQSADAQFDWLREGLADMLITDLAQSDQLTVLSRQQLHSILESIGYAPSKKVSLDEALKVAQHSHAEAVLTGSFTAVGGEIRVDVQLHDATSGQLVAADRVVSPGAQDLLTQVDLLSARIEDRLGVARTSNPRKPSLADAMTDNLEAYRYYSLGLEKALGFENNKAIALLKQATDLDPEFAMAYARIGFSYCVTDFLHEKGKPYLEKAFQLSGRLTEKDKLYIMAWYAIAQDDYPGAVRTFRHLIDDNPLEVEAYWRLGRLLLGEEQCEEAVRVLKLGLSVDPQTENLYNALGTVYMQQGKYAEAIASHKLYVQLDPNAPNPHDSLGMSYQRAGDYEDAVTEYRKALELNPEFEPAVIHLGDVYCQVGRYREAVGEYERYIKMTKSDVARALGYGSIAQIYLRMGEMSRAEQAAQGEVKCKKSPAWSSIAVALERHPKVEAASIDRIDYYKLAYPQRGARQDLRSTEYFKGYVALKRGRPDEAIAHFKEALRHLPPTSGIDLYEDCLANAYLQLRRFDEAIAEYQRVISSNPNYPLVTYHVGQAYEGRGEADRARIEYTRFLEEWHAADQEVPEVIEARRKCSTS
jgi:tetratricopeptide (TPR) repeat protein/DNA-binding winged helix-turn-helix (wHTH) protein